MREQERKEGLLPSANPYLASERVSWGILPFNHVQGRCQLLCLARVLLRRPSIVVLDEFTAGIDDNTAIHLQEVVHRACLGSTVLQVRQRLIV